MIDDPWRRGSFGDVDQRYESLRRQIDLEERRNMLRSNRDRSRNRCRDGIGSDHSPETIKILSRYDARRRFHSPTLKGPYSEAFLTVEVRIGFYLYLQTQHDKRENQIMGTKMKEFSFCTWDLSSNHSFPSSSLKELQTPIQASVKVPLRDPPRIKRSFK